MGYGVPDRCPPPSGSPLLNSWTPPVSVTTTTPQPWSSQLSLPSSGQACPVDNVQYPTSGCTAYDITLGDIDSPVEIDPFFVTYVECVTGREITIAVTEGSCFRVFAKNGTTPVTSPEEIIHPINGGGGWGGSSPEVLPVPCEIEDEDTQPPPVLPPAPPPEPPPSGTPTTTTTTAEPAPEPPLPPAPDQPQEFTYQTRILTLGEGTLSDEEVFLDNYNGRSGDDRWYQRSFEPQMYYLFNSYQFDADNTDYSKAIDSHWIYNWLGRAYAKGSDGGTIKPLYLDNMTVDENINTNLSASPYNIFTYTDKRTEDLAIDINYNLKGILTNPPSFNCGGLIIESYDDTRGDGDKLKYYFIGTVWGSTYYYSDIETVFSNLHALNGVYAFSSASNTEGYQRVALDSIPSSIASIYQNNAGQTQMVMNIMTPFTNDVYTSKALPIDDSLNWTSRCYGFDPHTHTVIGAEFGTPAFVQYEEGKSPLTFTQPVDMHFVTHRRYADVVNNGGGYYDLNRPDRAPIRADAESIRDQLAQNESLMVDHKYLKYQSQSNANQYTTPTFSSSWERSKVRLYAVSSDGSIDRDISDSITILTTGKRLIPATHSRVSLRYLDDGLFPELTKYQSSGVGQAFDSGDVFIVTMTFPPGHPSGIAPEVVRDAVLDAGYSPTIAANASGNYYTINTISSTTRDATMIASGCVPVPPIKNWMLIDYINDMRTDYE